MINKLDARHRIKRSNLTGVVPTVPASLTDFTDGTWLNTDIRPGEFFYNIPDMKLWIGTNSTPFELTGSFALPLANVLLNGNTSGASDIIMDITQVIKSGNGGGQLDLDYGGNPGEISLTTDNGGYAESFLYMFPSGIEMKNDIYGYTVDPIKTSINGNIISFESGTPSASIEAVSSLVTGSYKIHISGDYILSTMCNTTNSNTIVIKNTASTFSSDNNDMNSSIISSRNSTITAGSYNSVIISGNTNSIAAGINNIVGGNQNTNTSGDNNIISGSTNSTIGYGMNLITGENNTKSGFGGRHIIGGYGNIQGYGGHCLLVGYENTNNASNSIVCGVSNINNAPTSIVCGVSNIMKNPGIMYGGMQLGIIQVAQSSGMATHGVNTTNATPTIMFSGGVITGLELLNNSALRAEIVVLARDSSGNAKEWKATALVKNNAGTMSIVGSITFTSTLGDAALSATSVSATTNSTDKSLEITVTGLAATTISWGADIKYTYIS